MRSARVPTNDQLRRCHWPASRPRQAAIKKHKTDFYFRILAAFLSGLIFVGPASATTLGLDLKTDYRPGVDFIVARTTVFIRTGGGLGAQVAVDEKCFFTNTDAATGIRIATFDIPNGDYISRVELLDVNETVIARRDRVVDLTQPLFYPEVVSAGSLPQTCSESLGTVQTELATCNEYLTTVRGVLGAVKSELDDTKKELAVCASERTDARERLSACNENLQELTNDDDGDGIIAALDLCVSTAAGLEVDERGCSLEEFCARISGADRTRCRTADFNNDEPGGQPSDCTVQDGLCVPN
jgi:hypothetical protein